MIRATLAEVADAVGGALRPGVGRTGHDAVLAATGAAVDSRAVRPGDLFFALPGEHTDGHRFVGQALAAGAVAAVVLAGSPEAARPLIEVPDPARALIDLARWARGRMDVTVIGVTGSTGKTCTKDLIAAVLSTARRVTASPASFNNEIGLPLTLLAADEHTEVLVCEMGARGPGHIRMLTEVARPQVGVVTNVGVAHLEMFGSAEAIGDAKAELPESLPAEGSAILNADDPVVRSFASRTAARAVLFGIAPDAAVRAEGIEVDRTTGRPSFELITPDGRASVTLAVPGEHMVWNALAAAAAGSVLGIPVGALAEALAEARVSAGRMSVTETAGRVRIVNDAYNANPTSMAAALRAARWMADGGRCIAVLGAMAELGLASAEEHERVGELAARLRVDELVVVGAGARLIAVGAEREGVEPERIHRCDGVEEAAALVRRLARAGDLVLVKASRVERLERVAEALTEDAPAGPVGQGAAA
jgi:UDP-N-acetylmuramoyl-tripeptide--D-alanyl-D-alanine ligase